MIVKNIEDIIAALLFCSGDDAGCEFCAGCTYFQKCEDGYGDALKKDAAEVIRTLRDSLVKSRRLLRVLLLAIQQTAADMDEVLQGEGPSPIGKTLNDWSREIHANTTACGIWDVPLPFGEILAECHGELSRALDAYRSGNPIVPDADGQTGSIAARMIDCVLLILDWCGQEGVDADNMLSQEFACMKAGIARIRPQREQETDND